MPSLPEGSGPGTGCPERWGSHRPWGGSNTVQPWHLGPWFGRPGGVGLGLDLVILEVFSNFNDSMILTRSSDALSLQTALPHVPCYVQNEFQMLEKVLSNPLPQFLTKHQPH